MPADPAFDVRWCNRDQMRKCENYAGAMADCDAAVGQMIRLLNGETTAERTADWVRRNYPHLAGKLV